MTTKIKELICQKDKLYSRIKEKDNSFIYKQLFDGLQRHLSESIENEKKNVFSKISEKLSNPDTSMKCF